MIPHKTKHGVYTPELSNFATERKASEQKTKAPQQSATTINQFSYRKLRNPCKEIRLVEIKAQKSNAPLEIDLSIHSLADDLYFYAVSYTWGSGELSKTLLINGSPKMVTENCYYALSQIQSHLKSPTTGTPNPTTSKRVFLWIDSICINQNDLKEKGCQVTLMSDIYTKAVKVLACVGPHENDSEMLHEVLEETKSFQGILYSSRESILRNGTFTSRGFAGNIDEFLDSKRSSESFGLQLRKAFLAFANRHYWSRLWIIQEVAATNRSGSQLEVLCGTDNFSSSEVYLLFYIAGYMATDWKTQETHPIKADERDLYEEHTCHCFRFVMDATTVRRIMANQIFSFTNDRFKCSRPEDKIYGLLSLIKWRDNFPPVRPVYHDSAAFDLAKALICQTDWMPPSDIQRILKALEICYSHSWMRNLVARRSGGPMPTDDVDDKDPIHRFSGANHLVMAICKNEDNQLTASLVYSSDQRSSPTSVDHRAAILQRVPNKDDKTQLLFTGSEVGALLCGGAQVSDLMIQTGYGRSLLILRYTENEENCIIVGQGLLCTGFEFPRQLPERVDILEKRLERFQRTESHPKECLPYIEPRNYRSSSWEVTAGLSEKKYYEKRLGDQVEEAHFLAEVGYMTNIQLKAKPAEMVVLAEQDVEKDGSYNVEESLRRLSTSTQGTVRLIPMAN